MDIWILGRQGLCDSAANKALVKWASPNAISASHSNCSCCYYSACRKKICLSLFLLVLHLMEN